MIADCTEAYGDGIHPTEFLIIYIKPNISPAPFQVNCYLAWGGWTEIQIRDVDYPNDLLTKSWAEFQDGFGTIGCSYFLGLEEIYQILQNGEYKLDVGLTWTDGDRRIVYYSNFNMSDAETGYRLNWEGYTYLGDLVGRADDGFEYGGFDVNLRDKAFSTPDVPDSAGCASVKGTGWWYGTVCGQVNLNLPLNATAAVEGAAWPRNGVLESFVRLTLQMQRTDG